MMEDEADCIIRQHGLCWSRHKEGGGLPSGASMPTEKLSMYHQFASFSPRCVTLTSKSDGCAYDLHFAAPPVSMYLLLLPVLHARVVRARFDSVLAGLAQALSDILRVLLAEAIHDSRVVCVFRKNVFNHHGDDSCGRAWLPDNRVMQICAIQGSTEENRSVRLGGRSGSATLQTENAHNVREDLFSACGGQSDDRHIRKEGAKL